MLCMSRFRDNDHMKVSTVRELRDRAAGLRRSKEPVLITRRGRVAGILFPSPERTLPIELKRQLFDQFSRAIRKRIKSTGSAEAEIEADFESWRKERNVTGGRG